jgi:hypothetical protein
VWMGGCSYPLFCCVFGSLVSSPTMADGSPAIVGGGVADTRSMIQVRLGSGSTTPDLAAMLWGSSSTSIGGWSSDVGHGGRRCFSFVSVALADWIVISFSSRVLSLMWVHCSCFNINLPRWQKKKNEPIPDFLKERERERQVLYHIGL